MIGGRESDIKIQAQTKGREMFGMSKNDGADDDRASTLAQQRLAGGESATLMLTDGTSTISSDMTIVGKITGDGTLRIFGRVEGDLRVTTVLISAGADVEGNLVAEEITIGGHVKGTIRASRVTLESTAIVEADIFHRSLAMQDNARFEGTSRREDQLIAAPPSIPLGRLASGA